MVIHGHVRQTRCAGVMAPSTTTTRTTVTLAVTPGRWGLKNRVCAAARSGIGPSCEEGWSASWQPTDPLWTAQRRFGWRRPMYWLVSSGHAPSGLGFVKSSVVGRAHGRAQDATSRPSGRRRIGVVIRRPSRGASSKQQEERGSAATTAGPGKVGQRPSPGALEKAIYFGVYLTYMYS